MTALGMEGFLAKLYTDEDFRKQFLLDPEAIARRAGLSDEEARAVARIDRVGLEMAARTFAFKRRRILTSRCAWVKRLLRPLHPRA